MPTKINKNPNKMNDQQYKFARNILKHLEWSDGECYMDAYPNVKTVEAAAVCACKLLKNVKVIAYINKIRAKVDDMTKITLARLEQELARMALVNPQDFYDEDGNPIPIHELPEDTARALKGVKYERSFKMAGKEGEKQLIQEEVTQITYHDKRAAADTLIKRKGGYAADNKQKSDTLVLQPEAIKKPKNSGK